MRDDRLNRLEWLKVWGEIWLDLTEVFTQSKPSERAMELYAERLADIPAARLRAAAEQCMATCKWLPTIAELREAAGQVAAGREPVALDVYGDTIAELSLARAESRVPRLDPIAAEVVRAMGGQVTLLASDNGPADRARFIEAYEAKVAQERRIADVVPLARRLIPGPGPRPIGFAPRPLELPAADERPLSRDEAAEMVRRVREESLERLTAPGPETMPAVATEDASAETVDFARCGACSLEYPGDGRACPRCEFVRAFGREYLTPAKGDPHEHSR